MKRFFILFLLTLQMIVYCQEIKWDIPQTVGSGCNTISLDDENNMYLAGTITKDAYFVFSDSLPFHNTSYGSGYLIKADSAYNILFKKTSIGPLHKQKTIIDSKGDLILLAMFSRNLTFDEININFSSTDYGYNFLIAKYSSAGKLKWYNYFKGSYYLTYVNDMKLDSDDNIYIAGRYVGNLVFFNNGNVADTISGSKAMYFAKYDSDGNYLWSKSHFSDRSDFSFNNIAIDNNKYIYLSGHWYGDGGTYENIDNQWYKDLFIAKYDSSFNLLWLKQINAKIGEIAIDENLGSFYLAGSFRGESNFGNGIINSQDKNIFLARYSLNGALIWVKNMGSWSGAASYTEAAHQIYIDDKGLIYLGGTIGQNGVFDNFTISAYDNPVTGNLYFDTFVAKVTATGEILWVTHAGSPGYGEALLCLNKNNSDKIFLSGLTKGAAQFGENILDSNIKGKYGYFNRIIDYDINILNLSKTNITLNNINNIDSVELISNLNWIVTSSDNWLSITPMSGKGNSILRIEADTNDESLYNYENAVINIKTDMGEERTINVKFEAKSSSIAQNQEQKLIKIFPNPVNDYVNIKTTNIFPLHATIYDQSGKILFNQKVNENKIDVRFLKPGFYVVKFQTSKRIHTLKLIKN